MSQSRKLAAIMFTDIVGYTALMEEDEERAYELLRKNREIQRPIIENHNGKWLKEIGDGVLASFLTISDAIYAAGEIQKVCEDESDLKLRIGIHVGEVRVEGDDVFGSGVNIASRLEPLAPIGGIIVSGAVYKNIHNRKGINATFIQKKALRGIKEPVPIYQLKVEDSTPYKPSNTQREKNLVQVEGSKPKIVTQRNLIYLIGVIVLLSFGYFFYGQLTQAQTDSTAFIENKKEVSIAVLPFQDDSPDADNQYFADGMRDEISNYLQKISYMGVKSRTDVEPYRSSNLGLETIAAELGVDYILEGSVRKYGDQFRVNSQLIDVESGNNMWSEMFDGKISDTIFVIQGNIAKEIAAALDVVITPEEERGIDKFPTNSVEAYELKIKGSHEMSAYWNTLNRERLNTAHDFFSKALNKDPEYLSAISGLAGTFIAEQNYDSALYYAEKLVDHGSQNSVGYLMKAECYYFMGKLDLAIENYSTALKLSQFDAENEGIWTRVALGRALVATGDVLTALPYLAEAINMDNEVPAAAYITIANAFVNIGDYNRASRYFQLAASDGVCAGIIDHVFMFLVQNKLQRASEIIDASCNKQSCERQCIMARFYTSILKEEFEKAELYFSQLRLDSNDRPFSDLSVGICYVYYKLGRINESNNILNAEVHRLESLDYKNSRAYLNLSMLYAFKGNRVEALKNLTKYAVTGFSRGWQDFLLIDPFFEKLRNDPEFKSIIKQAQEEKAAQKKQVQDMIARGELDL